MRRSANITPRLWRSIIVAMAVIVGLRALIPIGFMPAFEGGRLSLIECTGHMARHGDNGVKPHSHGLDHKVQGPGAHKKDPSHWETGGSCPFSLGSISTGGNPQLFDGSATDWLNVIVGPVFAPPARSLPGSLSARGPPSSL